MQILDTSKYPQNNISLKWNGSTDRPEVWNSYCDNLIVISLVLTFRYNVVNFKMKIFHHYQDEDHTLKKWNYYLLGTDNL